MKDRSLVLFNVFGFSLLLIIVMYVGISIFLPVSVNSGKISVLFDSIRTSVLDDVFNKESSASRTSNFVRLSNLALARPSLRSLTVKDNKGNLLYIFSRNADSVESRSDSRMITVNQKADFIRDRAISGFEKANGELYNFTAIFTLISSKFIFNIIRNALILLCVYLLSSCFFLILTKSKYSTVDNKDDLIAPQTAREHQDDSTGRSDKSPHDSSHDSSLGSESYPIEKLTNELKRSASFDQDLVLVLMSLPKDFSDNFGESFEKLLKESFAYADLVFRFNETHFGVILPNEDIDKGITRIKEFDKQSINVIEQLNRFIVNYGLSSRNGRLIEGDVIFKEALAALKHAMNEKDVNIIAFRPDPAKYREFLANTD